MKKIINKFKRGFTIVELVIVIAVIAILAAVLIPTLSNVLNSAEESNDMVTVSNLNKIVAAYATVGDIETPSDALDGALENGYSVSNLTPTSEGNMIVYDENSSRFALISSSWETVYKDSSTTKDSADAWQTPTTWLLVTTSDATSTGTNSYTLDGNNSYILVGEDWNGASVTVKYGAILYDYSNTVTLASVIVNNSDSDAKKEVAKADGTSNTKTAINKTTIAKANTEGTIDTITVKVKADYLSCTTSGYQYTIKNYSITTATAVNSCTYLEYGTTSAYDAINIGKGTITNYSTTISSVTISVASGTSSSTIYTDTTGSVEKEETNTAISTTDSDGKLVLELGTVNYPYLIDSVDEWLEETGLYTSTSYSIIGKNYWKVTTDLDFTTTEKDYRTNLWGYIDFDGNSVTLNGYSLFWNVFGGSVSNLNLVINGEGTKLIQYIYMNYEDVTISNVTASGVFTTSDNNGTPFIGFVHGYSNDYTLTLKKCTNYTNITSTASAGAAVFIGKVYEFEGYGYVNLVLDTCINYGTLIHAKGFAGMIFANGATFTHESLENITIKNCVNYGKIYGGNTSGNSNLLCGAGQTKASISAIKEWVEANKTNLYNGEGGECEDKTFGTISVSDGNFNLSGLSTVTGASKYTLSFNFWVTIVDGDGNNASWGSYSVTITVSSLSGITLPAYSWISESDLTDEYTTKTVVIGGTTLKTATKDNVTYYYVFEESYVSSWGEGTVKISNTALTIYEYIDSSVGNVYTYTYTN